MRFYKPAGIPDGFHSIGRHCQSKDKPLHGFIHVVKEAEFPETADVGESVKLPALREPLDYTLVWSPDDGNEDNYGAYSCLETIVENLSPTSIDPFSAWLSLTWLW